MLLYSCTICGYSTNKKYYYERHLTTVKHLNNAKLYTTHSGEIITGTVNAVNNIIKTLVKEESVNNELKNELITNSSNTIKIINNRLNKDELNQTKSYNKIINKKNRIVKKISYQCINNNSSDSGSNGSNNNNDNTINNISNNNDNNNNVTNNGTDDNNDNIINDSINNNDNYIINDTINNDNSSNNTNNGNNTFYVIINNLNLLQMINICYNDAPPLTTPNFFDLYSNYITDKYGIDTLTYMSNPACTYGIDCSGNCNKCYMCPKNLKIGKELVKNDNSMSIKICASFVSSIIKHNYVKDNKRQQSIWNTDINRLSFIIKQVIDNKNNWYNDKGGIKINTILIKPFVKFLEQQLYYLLKCEHHKLCTYIGQYVEPILKEILKKKGSVKNDLKNIKKTKKKYKILEQELTNMSNDIDILTNYYNTFIDKKNYNGPFYIKNSSYTNQNIIIDICSKYDSTISYDYYRSYTNFGIKCGKLKQVYDNLCNNKLLDIVLKQISPLFYTNKQIMTLNKA